MEEDILYDVVFLLGANAQRLAGKKQDISEEDIKMAAALATKLVGEFLGTFLLMLTILSSGGQWLLIGLALAVIVFLVGPISGAAVNPAVSLGLWMSGSLDNMGLALYTLAELGGAAAAVWSYRVVA